MDYSDLPLHAGDGLVHVIVETPRGSAIKLKYDPRLRAFVWSRNLALGVRYPYDFGFLPQTLAEDGDGIDALVLSEAGSHPGVVVPGRILGALRVEQVRDGQAPRRNDRLIVVPSSERRWVPGGIGDLPQRVRDEIQAFFATSLLMTGKVVTFRGWAEAAEAEEAVRTCAARHAARAAGESG